MFDFDAGKLIIIGVVALIVIGPKELPRVLRQIGQIVAKMRRMAREFQGQFMEAMQEADLAEVKADLAKLKQTAALDLKGFNPVYDLRDEMTAAVEGSPSYLDPKPKLEPPAEGGKVSSGSPPHEQGPDVSATHATLGTPVDPGASPHN